MSWTQTLAVAWMSGALGIAWLGTSAAAEDTSPATAESVSKCVGDNAPAKTMRQRVELATLDRIGDARTYDVTGLWKREDDGLSKLVLRISAPPDLRGSAFLMIEREGRSPDLFSYLPELEKVRRISARGAGGSLFGSDFSYEDVQRIQNLAGAANSRLLGEDERAGRPAWKLESQPGPDEVSAYTRIVSWIDRERCVPLAAEFFGEGTDPTKLLSVPPAQVVREGDGWVIMGLTLQDLSAETQSSVRVKEVELDVELGEKHFSESALGRRR
jgi:hypothetical protein